MKKALLLGLAAVLLCFCACSGGRKQESSTDAEASAISGTESASESASDAGYDTVTTVSSSINDPLTLDTWGSTSKYSTASGEYVEIPIRLVSVRRGESVNAEVKRLAGKSIYAAYSEPAKNEEYALVTYELSLDGFPVKEGGTLIDVFAVVQGTDGEMLKLKDGSYFSTTALCLNDDEAYHYEGIVQGMMAYKIPKNCTEYLLTVGEPGETLAYFKGV